MGKKYLAGFKASVAIEAIKEVKKSEKTWIIRYNTERLHQVWDIIALIYHAMGWNA